MGVRATQHFHCTARRFRLSGDLFDEIDCILDPVANNNEVFDDFEVGGTVADSTLATVPVMQLVDHRQRLEAPLETSGGVVQEVRRPRP